MTSKAFFVKELDLPPDKPGGHCLQTAAEGVRLHAPVRADVGKDEPRRPAPEQAHAARRLTGGGHSPLRATLGSRGGPASEIPGLISAHRRVSLSALSLATEPVRRKPVDRKNEADPFHDSEAEDIYDLYNACNGVVRNGLLDISQLDEYTPEEAEALNVPKLREIWHHTASGCLQCASIVSTLNSIRGTLRGAEEETEAIDINVTDSIS